MNEKRSLGSPFLAREIDICYCCTIKDSQIESNLMLMSEKYRVEVVVVLCKEALEVYLVNE
ncbi:hypothetical protein [Pseudoalteromonas holothuriae]|uniref:hypothetical protein n=1 Tax=Pseudoalteromonas holothuriae TaxID=2963714 RepID=UPI0021C18505|nr:hypothetical protein [Pseudoalteromonas sp. CIP111951]